MSSFEDEGYEKVTIDKIQFQQIVDEIKDNEEFKNNLQHKYSAENVDLREKHGALAQVNIQLKE